MIKLQRRAVRIINKAGYRDSTNPWFIRSCTLKSLDTQEHWKEFLEMGIKAFLFVLKNCLNQQKDVILKRVMYFWNMQSENQC